jgi:hypothetical protein
MGQDSGRLNLPSIPPHPHRSQKSFPRPIARAPSDTPISRKRTTLFTRSACRCAHRSFGRELASALARIYPPLLSKTDPGILT